MTTYAIITNGIVENIISWSGNTSFPLNENQDIKRADNARIGEPWDDSMIDLPVDEVLTLISDADQPTTTGTQTL